MKVLPIICLLAMIIVHQRSADATFNTKAKLHPIQIDPDDYSFSEEDSLMMEDTDEISDESDESFLRSVKESDIERKRSPHKRKPSFPVFPKTLKSLEELKKDAAKLLIAKKVAKKKNKLLKKLMKKQKIWQKKEKKLTQLAEKKESKANKAGKEKQSEEDAFKGKKIVAMRECDRPSGRQQPRLRAEMPMLVPALEPVAAYDVQGGPCWNTYDDCLET